MKNMKKLLLLLLATVMLASVLTGCVKKDRGYTELKNHRNDNGSAVSDMADTIG